MSKPKRTAIRIDGALHQRVRIAAAINGSTIGDLAERALSEWLDNHFPQAKVAA